MYQQMLAQLNVHQATLMIQPLLQTIITAQFAPQAVLPATGLLSGIAKPVRILPTK